MSVDREQYIKQLEGRLAGYEVRDKQELLELRKKDREARLQNALMRGVFWGAFMPTVGYGSVLNLLGRTPGVEALVMMGVGVIAGPTIAFIRERRLQKQELQNQKS